MAQKFKLIERKNLGKDNKENPKKFYAQAETTVMYRSPNYAVTSLKPVR